jgi:hypothetical protein
MRYPSAEAHPPAAARLVAVVAASLLANLAVLVVHQTMLGAARPACVETAICPVEVATAASEPPAPSGIAVPVCTLLTVDGERTLTQLEYEAFVRDVSCFNLFFDTTAPLDRGRHRASHRRIDGEFAKRPRRGRVPVARVPSTGRMLVFDPYRPPATPSGSAHEGSIPWEARRSVGSFFETTFAAIFRPLRFFSDVGTGALRPAFVHCWLSLALSLLPIVFTDALSRGVLWAIPLALPLLSLVLAGLIFLGSYAVYLAIRVAGGRGGPTSIIRAFLYSSSFWLLPALCYSATIALAPHSAVIVIAVVVCQFLSVGYPLVVVYAQAIGRYGLARTRTRVAVLGLFALYLAFFIWQNARL